MPIDMPPLGEPGPSTYGSTSTLERHEVTPQLSEPGDHERFAHYVRKEKILESAVFGEAVEALCGKVWIPNRDPERFPTCPACKEIYDSMRSGEDEE